MTGDERRSRFLVVGSGGIGGVVSAHLAQAHDVTLLARRPAVAEVLERTGVTLVGRAPLSARCDVVRAVPAAAEGFDFILLAVEPTEVESAARSVVPLLAGDTRVVCFQNGLCEERVARIVGVERVIGGVVAWGASVVGLGVYERTSTGGFSLGRWQGAPDAPLATLERALSVIGPTRLTDNLTGVRWSKLAVNCAVSTLGTLGGARLGQLLKLRKVRRLALEIVTEALAVARAEGVAVEPLTRRLRLERLALPLADSARTRGDLFARHLLLIAFGLRYRRLRSSMLAAIERGKAPAVDFLNGEVVERGARHGIPTPVNEAAREAVWAISRGENEPSLATLAALYAKTR